MSPRKSCLKPPRDRHSEVGVSFDESKYQKKQKSQKSRDSQVKKFDMSNFFKKRQGETVFEYHQEHD